MALRVLSWNLFHGRAQPAARRELSREFTAALAGWSWDVALLQEVPPWWPPALAEALGAQARHVLTSRNAALAMRRAVAVRAPELIKSNGGGANAILVRGGALPVRHETMLIRRFPERRRLHAVELDCGWWVGNLHAQGSVTEAHRAAERLTAWAGKAPAVLGGDFNHADPAPPGFALAAGNGVDLIFARGLEPRSPGVLDPGPLSDHAPVAVTLARPPGP